MLKEYRIIDADCHVMEPIDMWGKYLEPTFQGYAPSKGYKVCNEDINYKFSPQFRAEATSFYQQNHLRAVLGSFNAETQVRQVKQLGIDIAFLYPTYGLWIFSIDTMPWQLAGAFVRAYNNWLRDYCNYNPQILKGVGAINLHAPQEMVPELQRIVEFGWKAVFLRPNPVKGRLLCDPAYEAFWSECERLGVSVGIHEGTHSRLPTAGADRFETRFALHACSHPMEQMMAMLALIEGGVLERHPNLQIGFLEAGCGWLPSWLWRLDEEYEKLAWEVEENVKMKPSEYFRRQCFIGVDPGEPGLEQVIEFLGSDDNLIFGSDYPHTDHKSDIVEAAISLNERVPEKTLHKLLWDNPARFYRLE